ncbi:MAG: TIGR03032 family protein [Pirellulaceae bacterium]
MSLVTLINAPQWSMTASRGFVDWLDGQEVSLAISTYQTGKLFLVGRGDERRFSVYERTFERAMGLAGNGQTIYMATLFQLWRLENMLQPDEILEGNDRYYVPQVGQTTGDLDVHDVALDVDGRPLFVSARFSCLATTSDRYHFHPLWMPKFISKLAGEDRCHLNGLATVDGKPRFVTACARTDVVDGWREHRRDGGVVIEIDSDEIVAHGLSMPHSPRWYRDKLWLLDSGNGAFGHLDLATGKFETVTFCPGYARGLAFTGDYAVIGLSLPRHDKTFEGLALEDKLAAVGVSARCGLLVIDLRSGDAIEWLRLEDPVRELYDVLVLPGVRRPRLVGFKTDEIRTRVWADPEALRKLCR